MHACPPQPSQTSAPAGLVHAQTGFQGVQSLMRNKHCSQAARRLCRAGRVARAGRTGKALSLLTREELPYLLDLHLFLSRSAHTYEGIQR